MKFTKETVAEVIAAYQKMEDFKQHVLKRAQSWVAIHQNHDGVKVPEVKIFDPTSGWVVGISDMFDTIHGVSDEVKISYRDVQGDGDEREFTVPSDFVFAENNELDQEYENYLKLKEKFEGK